MSNQYEICTEEKILIDTKKRLNEISELNFSHADDITDILRNFLQQAINADVTLLVTYDDKTLVICHKDDNECNQIKTIRLQ